MREQDLQRLREHAERVLALLAQARQESAELRIRVQALEHEREDLKHRNEVARERVETIISRLKALDSQAQDMP